MTRSRLASSTDHGQRRGTSGRALGAAGIFVLLLAAVGCESVGNVGGDGSAPAPGAGGGTGAGGDEGQPGAAPTIAVLDAHPVLTDTEARVWVELSHPHDEPITVQLDTVDATAIGDSNGNGDYVPVSVQVTIAAGSTRPAWPVLIAVDTPYKTLTLETALARHFETRLSNPSAGTLADAEGVVTLGPAGMVIETPLASHLAEVDAIDDFNGDGKPDLLLSGSAARAAMLLTPATTFEEGRHIVVDDAYLDGIQAFSWHVSSPLPADYVFADHGQATDVNGDGLSDALVIGVGQAHILYGRATPIDNFELDDPRLEDGDHATRMADFYFGYGPGPIQTGDWNDDGIMDFAQPSYYSTSHPGSNDQVHGFFGESGPLGGVFHATQTFSFQSGTAAVGQGSLFSGTSAGGRADLNGDGIDDFIYVGLSANDGQFGGNYLYARFGDGSTFVGQNVAVKGTLDGVNGFQISNDAFMSGTGSFTPQDSGDVNGDGIDDLVLSSGGYPLTVIFGRAAPYASGAYASLSAMGDEAAVFNTDPVDGARIGDLNGDGIGDVVFITENKLRILWGQADLEGKDIYGTQYPDVGEVDIDPDSGLTRVGVVADLDGDGADDIVILSDSWQGDTGGAVVVFARTITPTLGGPEIEPPR